MAKRKSAKRTKRATKKVTYRKKVDNSRLNILLLILALSVLILAAVTLS